MDLLEDPGDRQSMVMPYSENNHSFQRTQWHIGQMLQAY